METSTETRSVACEDGVLEYQLTRKKVKNINMRIKPDGRILVSANRRVSVAFLDDFVRKNQSYILRVLEKYKEREAHALPDLREYVDGEPYRILGEAFTLKVLEGEEGVWTEGDLLYLSVKKGADTKRKEKLVTAWLKALEEEIFGQICGEIYPLFEEYKIAYPQMKIRTMTSRWGSCHPKKGIITLNSKLIEMPRSCIEYVVLHEFAHFIHPNHSKEFYGLVASLMPDWKERKKELDSRTA